MVGYGDDMCPGDITLGPIQHGGDPVPSQPMVRRHYGGSISADSLGGGGCAEGKWK